MEGLLLLLGQTVDGALAASYRSFALGLASLLEARLLQGAELLWRPALRAISRLLGGSIRHWAIIAATGLILRAHRLHQRSGGISHVFSVGENDEATPIATHRNGLPSGGALALALPNGCGTLYFVPSGRFMQQNNEVEHLQDGRAPPMMISGPVMNSITHRSRL
ncbi:MAG: hypothetical protein SGPRY_003037 [Prymnesium sp.]